MVNVSENLGKAAALPASPLITPLNVRKPFFYGISNCVQTITKPFDNFIFSILFTFFIIYVGLMFKIQRFSFAVTGEPYTQNL